MKPIFPKWMNSVPTLLFVVVHSGIILVIAGLWYYATPKFWEVGYMPTQPGTGFNHQIHAGKLGIDCRYCHTHVEESWHANVPAVSSCMGCHAENKLNVEPGFASATDDKVQFIRDAYATDSPIQWRKVHVVPDYANFPHNAHINAGVSCFSCHGQIQSMPVVAQEKSLSMGWCLDCHRNPTDNLVPKDKVTDLFWVQTQWFNKLVYDENNELELDKDGKPVLEPVAADDRVHDGQTPEQLVATLQRNPPLYCAACHY